MEKIVWGLDPSMSHTALVMAKWDNDKYYDWSWYQQDSVPIKQIKGQYKYQTDFERFSLIMQGWKTFTELEELEPDIIHVEAPTGSQSSRAAIGYGVSWMVVSYLKVYYTKAELYLHKPDHVKKGVTGNPKAKKREMIEAASSYFPDFPWTKDKKGSILSKEEHKADALCTLKYGMENNI